jgi:hypothetical protein
MKVFGGTLSGIFTAIVRDQSVNVCFNSVISATDTALEYSYTSAIVQRKDWIDWTLWATLDIGLLIFFAGRAIYACASTDPNFGWYSAPYLPEADISKMVISPWTQDFIISLGSVFTGVKLAITRNQDIDPFWISKKLSQGITGSIFYLAKLALYKVFGF